MAPDATSFATSNRFSVLNSNDSGEFISTPQVSYTSVAAANSSQSNFVSTNRSSPRIVSVKSYAPSPNAELINPTHLRSGMSHDHLNILSEPNGRPVHNPNLGKPSIAHSQNQNSDGSEEEMGFSREAAGFLKRCLNICNNRIVSALLTPVIRFLDKLDSITKVLGINLGKFFYFSSSDKNDAQRFDINADFSDALFMRTHLH